MTNNKKLERYLIGGEFGDEYLTRQEARCMVCFLKGATLKMAADTLELSPRTVEYYVNNMKKRLGYRSKSELVIKIAQTPFARQVQREELSFS